MDKRELLLEAATKLFVERGFHATPTSAITKEAGVSAGILFHYFKTKDDLIVELYVALKKEYTGAILNDIEKLTSDISKVRLIWSNSWSWGLEHPLKFQFLLQADNSIYAESIKNHPEIVAKYELFRTLIQKYINDGIFKDIDIYFLMGSMFGLITTMIKHLTMFPELKSDQSFIEQAWEMYYNYLKP